MAKTDDLVFSPKVKATTKTVPASTHGIASSKRRTPSWNATAGSWGGQCKGKRSSSKLNARHRAPQNASQQRHLASALEDERRRARDLEQEIIRLRQNQVHQAVSQSSHASHQALPANSFDSGGYSPFRENSQHVTKPLELSIDRFPTRDMLRRRSTPPPKTRSTRLKLAPVAVLSGRTSAPSRTSPACPTNYAQK